ncbi:LIC12353 family lipoprotein [Leptospira dzoumogneensis]|uniref:Lipoprotein n=1 Tax=Leptospira dzoumogneensis TaxID=2484904 RepID=A0A4Z1APF5_9LEPT|nr:hypothetical protein [Leptospira dzoumogneensis]TGM95944.1 hypothetical protein EHR06_17885 [Leptospira dzoumogneensis]
MFRNRFKINVILLTLFGILINCGDGLRGKPTPAIPELAGFYVNERSKEWFENGKIKIQTLWIRRTAKGEMEFSHQILIRLQFSLSENREELKVKSGKLLTSDRELLFFETNGKEFHRNYHGQNTKDPKSWAIRSFGPFMKVKDFNKLIGEGTGRSAELAQDKNSIVFSNGDVYRRIGNPLLGRISINLGKFKKTIDNEAAGVILFPLDAEAFPQTEGKQNFFALFSTTDNVAAGTPIKISEFPGQVQEVFEHVAVVELNKMRPGIAAPSIQNFSSVILDGVVDTKTFSQKESTDELIRRLKQDPNVSKEELIRELEKLKSKE